MVWINMRSIAVTCASTLRVADRGAERGGRVSTKSQQPGCDLIRDPSVYAAVLWLMGDVSKKYQYVFRHCAYISVCTDFFCDFLT